MKRFLLAAAAVLVSSAAYGATSITTTLVIDPRRATQTGCEVASNSAQPLVVTAFMYNTNGRQLKREVFTVPPFATRISTTALPVEEFHCRFVIPEATKDAYMGAAKGQFLDADGIVIEVMRPDR